jgi:hypothetical protein
LRYLLLILIAVTIVISLQAVGIALVVAMLVTPAAAAYLLTRRLPTMMAHCGPHWRLFRRGRGLCFLLLECSRWPGGGVDGDGRFPARLHFCAGARAAGPTLAPGSKKRIMSPWML